VSAHVTIESPNPEWRLLKLVTSGLVTGEQQSEFEQLLRGSNLRWGEILEQSIRHKVIELLGYEIDRAELWDAVPGMIGEHFRATLRMNRYRIAVYRRAALEIIAVLKEPGVRVACTKGIVLEQTLYDGKGQRPIGDIDFMINPEDGKTVTAVMHDLGFEHGYLDQSTGKIKSFTRRDLIGYSLNPDHLAPFFKNLDDPLLMHVHADFACSLTWTQCRYQIPVSEALADLKSVAVPGGVLPCLNLHYQFIFTLLHLLREAWVLNWVDLGQDVNLIKFADVIRFWQRFQDQLATEEFHRLLCELKIEEPVAWVLVHLDRTFGMNVIEMLQLEGKVSEDFLASGSPRGGQQVRWRGTMSDRLQSKNRRELLVQSRELEN
jgi:hypothetical protein